MQLDKVSVFNDTYRKRELCVECKRLGLDTKVKMVRKAALSAHTPPILSKRAGGGATEQESWWLPGAPPHSLTPLQHEIRWPVTSRTTPYLQIRPNSGSPPAIQTQVLKVTNSHVTPGGEKIKTHTGSNCTDSREMKQLVIGHLMDNRGVQWLGQKPSYLLHCKDKLASHQFIFSSKTEPAFSLQSQL